MKKLVVWSFLIFVNTCHALEINWYLSTKNLNAAPLSVKESYLTITSAMDKWMAVCPVKFKFSGFVNTSMLAHYKEFKEPSFKTVIGWRQLLEFQSQLSGSTTLITNLVDGKVIEGHLALDPRQKYTHEEWAALLLHEVGHMIGLPHTDIPHQVMSYPYSTLQHMRRLQSEDMKSCANVTNDWRNFGELNELE